MDHIYPCLEKLGLSISNFAHGPSALKVDKPVMMLSTRHPQKSALPAMRVTLTHIDQLSELIVDKTDISGDALEALAKSEQGLNWEEVDAQTMDKLRSGLFRHMVAQGSVPASLKQEITRHFIPMPVSVFAAKDITIKAGTTFIIGYEDHEPVVCDFGTVTLEEGGLIQVESPALINIQKFIKKTA